MVSRKSPRRGALVGTVVATSIAVVGILIALQQSTAPPQGSWTVVSGVGSASDGRLTISIDNYSYANGQQAGFQRLKVINANPSSLLFLMVNVTVVNVGGRDADISSGFFVKLWNGTGNIVNTVYIDNGSIPGQFPYLPLFLRGGQQAKGWLPFYLPGSSPGGVTKLTFQELSYREFHYGGQRQSDGSWVGSASLTVLFVITPK